MHVENRHIRLLVLAAFLAVGGFVAFGQDAHDDHGPDKTPTSKDDHEGHEGHDEDEGHDDHEGHDEHEDELRVELTAEQRKRVGLTLEVARPGTISVSGTFPGEVVLDPDRVVRVVPRVAGIVRQVHKTLGDPVDAGGILAWIESDELAEAKLDYYAKQVELDNCRIRHPRAKEIFENVNRLLVLLKDRPDQEALGEIEDRDMGAYRGQLLTAYAEYSAARSAYGQEEALRGKQISSERERVEAAAAFEKARAGYVAAMDTARYQVRLEYVESASRCRVAEFEAAAAEQRLRLKGVDDDTIGRLRDLVPTNGSHEPCLCDDRPCKHGEIPSVMEALAKDKRFGWAALRSPMAGFVIEKNLSLGEKADGEESVFAIADTSSVWVRFNVYQKDLASVRPGLKVQVSPGAGGTKRDGVVSYVAPIVDEKTRTVRARIVLKNSDGTLRPGLYATVRVEVGAVRAVVVVPKAAVQIVEQREVVFVEDGDGFVAAPVTLGASDRTRVAVTSGLRAGRHYVVIGAFELKAKLAISGLGAHAGHGH